MTEVEVNEKFKDTPLFFKSYYKYNFTFAGVTNQGLMIVAGFGGNSDDIYKEDIRVEKPIIFGECDNWKYVDISDGDKVIFKCRRW